MAEIVGCINVIEIIEDIGWYFDHGHQSLIWYECYKIFTTYAFTFFVCTIYLFISPQICKRHKIICNSVHHFSFAAIAKVHPSMHHILSQFRIWKILTIRSNTSDMKPLAINRQVFEWLRVCSISTEWSTFRKLASIVLNLIVFLMNLSAVIASAIFILKFVTINLEECLFSLHHGIASLNALFALSIALLFRHKINDLFGRLDAIYDASKSRL